MMKKAFLMGVLMALSVSAMWGRTWFVAPFGNDNQTGTFEEPWRTFGHAQNVADPGDTVYFRQGIYVVKPEEVQDHIDPYDIVFHITRSGKPDAPIVFSGFRNERAVFDFHRITPEGRRVTAFLISADYIVMRQIEVVQVQVTIDGHTQSECVRMEPANNCLLQKMSFHDGMGIGVYIISGANNVIEDCDAYNNYDSHSESKGGGNVDGFGAHVKRAEHTGNVFRRCRAWWNSDDGFDLIHCVASVRIEDCVSFYNGYRPGTFIKAGDGSGFKVGGFGMSKRLGRRFDVAPRHVITRCVAYKNRLRGIYVNHHLAGCDITDNISIGNLVNYSMICRKSIEEIIDVPGYDHVISGNLSVAPELPGMDYIEVDSSRCTLRDNRIEASLPNFVPEDYIKL